MFCEKVGIGSEDSELWEDSVSPISSVSPVSPCGEFGENGDCGEMIPACFAKWKRVLMVMPEPFECRQAVNCLSASFES